MGLADIDIMGLVVFEKSRDLEALKGELFQCWPITYAAPLRFRAAEGALLCLLDALCIALVRQGSLVVLAMQVLVQGNTQGTK